MQKMLEELALVVRQEPIQIESVRDCIKKFLTIFLRPVLLNIYTKTPPIRVMPEGEMVNINDDASNKPHYFKNPAHESGEWGGWTIVFDRFVGRSDFSSTLRFRDCILEVKIESAGRKTCKPAGEGIPENYFTVEFLGKKYVFFSLDVIGSVLTVQ